MLYAIVGMLVIILDQGVKYWVTNHIMLNTITEPLIPGVLSLVRMHNDGAAFSFLAGGGARIYFVILTAVFTVAVILALVTNFINGKFGRWCLVLVTAGGLSNCLDRILYGYVVDMFKIDLFDFAVFNVADIFITVFALLFILYVIFGGENRGKKEEDVYDAFDDEETDNRSLKDDFEFTMGAVKSAKPEKKPRTAERVREEKPERRIPRRSEEEEPEIPPMRKPRPVSAGNARSRYELEIPQSQPVKKREKTADYDPFDAWEKASAAAESAAAESPAAKIMEAKPRRSAPVRSVKTEEPPKSVEKPIAKPAAKPVEKPAMPAAKATKKPAAEEDFSLDDILAEFRD